MEEFQKKIGYRFNNEKLLETALTHSSYSKEKGHEMEFNERLEFLGDAFFDAVIGEELFRAFPEKGEGFLSRTRASLVCEDSLVKVARDVKVGRLILLGHGEDKSGGREKNSILADSMEAVMGAVFLDGGYEAVRAVVLKLFSELIEEARSGRAIVKDYKTRLQELLQADGGTLETMKYVDVGAEGPDHDKIFTVRLEIEGEPVSEGKGKSKKQAQQAAAEAVLKRRGNAF
ncbi:MAG: ribonuclease III [Eubacteriales bacterium]|nr:ribonuclease III [Eubacteriales bacterium]